MANRTATLYIRITKNGKKLVLQARLPVQGSPQASIRNGQWRT